MTPRTLPIVNAIGCLALTGLIVAQWRKERTLDGMLAGIRTELAAANDLSTRESQRRATLEHDVVVLKEVIETTQQAAESSARTLVEKDQLATRLQTDLAAARTQVTAWETALKARDERLRALDKELAATRKRLDEAIAKLKDAGAR